MGATITRGLRAGSARRHITHMRRPIVSVDGLTRSNGRVSQAGNHSTASGPSHVPRSSARVSASATVGTATTIGDRLEVSATAAM